MKENGKDISKKVEELEKREREEFRKKVTRNKIEEIKKKKHFLEQIRIVEKQEKREKDKEKSAGEKDSIEERNKKENKEQKTSENSVINDKSETENKIEDIKIGENKLEEIKEHHENKNNEYMQGKRIKPRRIGKLAKTINAYTENMEFYQTTRELRGIDKIDENEK